MTDNIHTDDRMGASKNMQDVLGMSLISVSLLPGCIGQNLVTGGQPNAGRLRTVFLCQQEKDFLKKLEIKLMSLVSFDQILDFMNISAKTKSSLHKYKKCISKRKIIYK